MFNGTIYNNRAQSNKMSYIDCHSSLNQLVCAAPHTKTQPKASIAQLQIICSDLTLLYKKERTFVWVGATIYIDVLMK